MNFTNLNKVECFTNVTVDDESMRKTNSETEHTDNTVTVINELADDENLLTINYCFEKRMSEISENLLSESYLTTMTPSERLNYFKALSNHTKEEEKAREQLQHEAYKKRRRVGTESQFIPEYKLENTKLPKFMLLHFGRTRLLWDWLILLIVAYIAITVPYTAAFGNVQSSMVIIDLCFELIFVCDIAINFRTTFIESKSARLITNPKEIAKNYLHGWFLIDCLATLPFDWLFFVNKWFSSNIQYFKICRLLRLFRILRRVNRYIEYTATLLILMMFSFALLAHWFACVWYVIGNMELNNGKKIGWLYSLGDQIGKPYRNATTLSSTEKYVSALYFVFTSLTTVGFGNIAPNTVAEKTFSVLVLLLGAIVQSAIFGNMTAVIQKLYAARARFHAKASQIKQFVRHHQIDGELRRRIEDWFISHWSISKGVNTEEMLESFPSELQADISLHLYRSFLTLPCFAHASRGCLRSISLKVKKAYFSPGELVIKEKDAINAIFFVQRGTIEIVQRDFIVAILGTGDLFGEDISKMRSARRSNGDVRALMYCDILYLTRENINEVLQHYPDFCENFSQNIGLSFDLSTGKARTSTGLGSIIEEVDEYQPTSRTSSESHSSEDDNDINSNKPPIKRRNSRSSRNKDNHANKLPLWQLKLRNQELEISNSPTTENLKSRLMNIDSTTCSDEEEDSISYRKTSNRSRKQTALSETSFSENIDHYLPIAAQRSSDSSDIVNVSFQNQEEHISTTSPLMNESRIKRCTSERYSRKTSFPLIHPVYHEASSYCEKDVEKHNSNDLYDADIILENVVATRTRTESREQLIRKSSSKSLPENSYSQSSSIRASSEETVHNALRKTSKLYSGSTHSYLSVPTVSLDDDDNGDVSSPVVDRHSPLSDQAIYTETSDEVESNPVGTRSRLEGAAILERRLFDVENVENTSLQRRMPIDNSSYKHCEIEATQDVSRNCGQVTRRKCNAVVSNFTGFNGLSDSTSSNASINNILNSTDRMSPENQPYMESNQNNENSNGISISSDEPSIVTIDSNGCNGDHAWSHLATELINLKKGDVQGMKHDMTQLKEEIHMIKQGMESLTELVRNALCKHN